MKEQNFRSIIIIGVVTFFIMLFNLGTIPLLDPDEPVYAETAVEMIATHDFISPRIYGDYWYDKPPMYYWLTALSTGVFGKGEFSARFPSAVMAIGTVFMVYFVTRKFFRQRAAILSALILATSFEFFYLGKAAVTDMTLTFFFSGVIFAYMQKKYWLMYVCMALAVLTKGPVGLVLPGAIIGIHLMLIKDWKQFFKMKLVSGLSIFFLIAAPWYMIMYHLHGMTFVETFLGFHNITRFLQSEHSGVKWHYYVPVLLIGFFPWAIYLFQAIFAGIKERKGKEGCYLVLMLTWIGSVFVFFSISQTKLISYILPLYPAMAILTGWYIDRLLSAGKGIVFGVSLLLFFIFSVMIIVILGVESFSLYGSIEEAVVYLGMVLGFMLFGMGLAVYSEQYRYVIHAMILGMVCFVVVLMQYVFPLAAEFVSVKSLTDNFYVTYQQNFAPVYVNKFYRPGFCYYTGVSGIVLEQPLEKVVENEKKAYFFVKESQYQNLSENDKIRLKVIQRKANMILFYKG